MSLSAVPGDGEMYINGMWHAGRQLRAASGLPVAWVSNRALGSGLVWANLAEKSAESGLQPFLLYGVGFDAAGPLSEQVSDPEDTTTIDGMDVAEVLEGWWWAPDEAELAQDEELREVFAPFGGRFPGLASAVEEELDPELMRRALVQYTRHAQIGLVPAGRPADILPRLGWAGAVTTDRRRNWPWCSGRGRTGSARGCSKWATKISGSWSAGRRRPWRLRSR